MKKIFIIFIVMTLIILSFSHDQFLWCKKLMFGEPASYTIQKGEYLSQIAQKYYGDPDYWRELALINRAPNSNLVFPGEKIIVPSKEVIEKVRKTRWLSRVNEYINGEEEILAQATIPKSTVMAVETVPEPVKPVQTNQSSTFYLTLAAVAIIGIIISGLLYRSKIRRNRSATIDEIDLRKTTRKNGSEPDYREYLRNRKKEKAVIMN